MITSVTELQDMDARKVMVYELEEAPEGHGGLPSPRSTQSNVISVVKETPYMPGEPIFTEVAYRKEWREQYSILDDGTIEVAIYQVWIPDEYEERRIDASHTRS